MKAGDKITKTMYMSICQHTGVIDVTQYDPSLDYLSSPKPAIGTFEVEITVPEFDAVAVQVKMLENQLAKLNADHHVATQNIKDQIQRLLAIGHDSHDGGVV